MSENNVDSMTEIRYNARNDDTMIVVKMDEQRSVNDTDCRHEQLIADPNDRLGKAIMHMCGNHKCGVGFYIQPTKK